MDLLLQGDNIATRELVQGLLQSGKSLEDVLLDIVQPAQFEIGRMWQLNQITVAQEHLATATSQSVLAQLTYTGLFRDLPPSIGLTMIAMCPGDELHEFGMRAVSDMFALRGWKSLFLGAQTPLDDVVALVNQHRPDLLALSATIVNSVNDCRTLIAKIRKLEEFTGKIIVGGYAFNLDASLWKTVGADGYAADVKQAMLLAKQWYDF